MEGEPVKTEEAVAVITENTVEKQTEEKHPSNNKPWLFKPGQSGNPDGKPKGAKHFKTLFIEAVKEIGAKNARGEDISKDKVIVKKIIDQAMAGNLKAADMVIGRVDGDKEDAPLLQVNVIALTQEQQEALQNLL